jgi:hypothetical protein
MTAENQPQPPKQQAAGGDAAAKAAGALDESRRAEDDAVAQRRLEEDQAVADRRTDEDRKLASTGHRLFLAAAAMTAAISSGDMTRVSGANTELQTAVDAHLALSNKPE